MSNSETPITDASFDDEMDAQSPQDQKTQGAAHRSVAEISELIDALRFYASAETYHAVMIVADHPAGDFADDLSDDHGNQYYDRPMPGKLARETLSRLGVSF